MSEEQIKFLCKWLVENGDRPLSPIQKELIKQAIDASRDPFEMIAAILVLLQKIQQQPSGKILQNMFKINTPVLYIIE